MMYAFTVETAFVAYRLGDIKLQYFNVFERA